MGPSSPLKRARERARLSASDISRLTHLSPRIVSAMDDERYEELPAGIYARTAVRAYAAAVGLDPSVTLAILQPRLPDAPLDLLAVAELRTPPRGRSVWRYTLAATVDAAVLVLIGGATVAVCAATCGLSASALVRSAPASMAALCSTPVLLYFWLLGATDVRTLGPWLLDVEILPRSAGPLSLRLWARRGLLYAVRELTLAMRARRLEEAR